MTISIKRQSMQQLRISTINPDDSLRQADHDCLQMAGHHVVAVKCWRDLRGAAKYPDLFVVEATNGMADRFRLVREIREASQMVGILVMSSGLEPSDRTDAFLAGADNYIIRPCAVEILLAIVASLQRRLLT